LSSASPLGRYDDEPSDDQLHEVRLLRVPVKVLIAGREHHDDLMREFALLALAADSARSRLPARLIELTEILGVRYGRAAARPSEEIDAALQAGQSTVDLTYQVPAHIVEAAETLEALMREADEFCRSEDLLTLRRSDVVADFSHWYLTEFTRQVQGEPPTPWSGPLEP
jgi:hypothetical protein